MTDLFIGNKGVFLPSKVHLNISYDFFFTVLLLLRDKKDNSETQKKNILLFCLSSEVTDENVKNWWIGHFVSVYMPAWP